MNTQYHESKDTMQQQESILSRLENLDDRLMFTAVGLRNFYLMAA
ncbi:MAG: hypothetical protein O4806_12890 [Trichodesmium sp. St5_bin8]|nr:hypothetical protein [Trichodesmium sp. St5_bin8]